MSKAKGLEVPDFDAIEEEWRTVPSDLAGWAMRASAMMVYARKAFQRLVELEVES